MGSKIDYLSRKEKKRIKKKKVQKKTFVSLLLYYILWISH